MNQIWTCFMYNTNSVITHNYIIGLSFILKVFELKVWGQKTKFEKI